MDAQSTVRAADEDVDELQSSSGTQVFAANPLHESEDEKSDPNPSPDTPPAITNQIDPSNHNLLSPIVVKSHTEEENHEFSTSDKSEGELVALLTMH